MARTYKDMRAPAGAQQRDMARQRKADNRVRTSVVLTFGYHKEPRPSQLTRGERPWRLAKWRLEGGDV